MKSAASPEYAVGQVWTYETRLGEEGSRIHIAGIDEGLADEPIFHVQITGLMLKNPRIEGSLQHVLPHSPVGRETLDASVIALVGQTASPPDVSEGYEIWRKEFERGGAGYFTIPLKNIVQFIEEISNESQ